MHQRAWMCSLERQARRPAIRAATVLALAMSLWAFSDRREPVVEHSLDGLRFGDLAKTGDRPATNGTSPPSGSGRLAVSSPPRAVIDRVEPRNAGAGQANFVSNPRRHVRTGVQTVGFSEAAMAPPPAWLTGEVVFE